MLFELANRKDEIIRLMIIDKDYNKSIGLLKEYINLVNILEIEEFKADIDLGLWFAYYNIGLCYKKLGQYEKALKYTGMSLGSLL